MDTAKERACLGLALLSALAWGLHGALAPVFRLKGWSAAAPFMGLAAAVALTAWFRARWARRAEEERRDEALPRQPSSHTALFAAVGEGAPLSVERSRRAIERFMVPFVTPLLAAASGWAARGVLRGLDAPADAPAHRLAAVAVLGVEAFVLFLAGRVALGLSRPPGGRLLRGPGVYAALACLAALAAAAGALGAEAGWPAADRFAALALGALLALLAVEWMANTVVSLYRPVRDQDRRAAYESRMAALLADPTAWRRSLNQTLDYQFGFGLSRTWFYRFLERALVPYVLFQAAVLWSLTCFVVIGPEEEGILERFGRPPAEGWRLESGFHWKRPWPFESVRRQAVGRIHTLSLGFRDADPGRRRVLVWTEPHYDHEDLFLTASRNPDGADAGTAVPVNLLSVNIPVEYRITNSLAYTYRHADPARLVEQLALRALSRELAGRDLFDILAAGHQRTAEALKARLQEDADRWELGVGIVFVGLQGVHPPVAVAEAFEAVVGALETREASVLRARGYEARVVPSAEAEKFASRRGAEAYRAERSALARAEADAFGGVWKADWQAPRVYRTWRYLRTLRDALAHARLFVLAVEPSTEVFQLNYEDKLRPDLFDIVPGSGGPKGGAR